MDSHRGLWRRKSYCISLSCDHIVRSHKRHNKSSVFLSKIKTFGSEKNCVAENLNEITDDLVSLSCPRRKKIWKKLRYKYEDECNWIIRCVDTEIKVSLRFVSFNFPKINAENSQKQWKRRKCLHFFACLALLFENAYHHLRLLRPATSVDLQFCFLPF